MKTPSTPSKYAGFTLVELLVVIVIIMVLAGLSFSVGSGMMQRARKTAAQQVVNNIATSVEQFYSEYNLLPDPKEGTDEDNVSSPFETNETDGITLLEILSGLENQQNERKLRFLNVKEADKGNRDGIIFSPAGDEIIGLFDPWGEPYYVILDYDYDDRLEFSPSSAYNYEAKLNSKRVAVFSLGTDSPTDAQRKDLVKSW
ncbi:MAG: hypothetical protein RL346_1017 [Verrucomicrobiota bacterium]|jgi:prepilin-type N-terminal cleavage/methylation domain-containing protein